MGMMPTFVGTRPVRLSIPCACFTAFGSVGLLLLTFILMGVSSGFSPFRALLVLGAPFIGIGVLLALKMRSAILDEDKGGVRVALIYYGLLAVLLPAVLVAMLGVSGTFGRPSAWESVVTGVFS